MGISGNKLKTGFYLGTSYVEGILYFAKVNKKGIKIKCFDNGLIFSYSKSKTGLFNLKPITESEVFERLL